MNPRSKSRGIKAELRRSLGSANYGAVHLALHPFSKLLGIRAKVNKWKKKQTDRTLILSGKIAYYAATKAVLE